MSWGVYCAFFFTCYLLVFGLPVVKLAFGKAGSFRDQKTWIALQDLLLHDFDFLAILFCAASVPLVAGFTLRAFVLLILAKDKSWFRNAAVIWLILAVTCAAVKLALSGLSGEMSAIQALRADPDYFFMCMLMVIPALVVLGVGMKQ